MGRTDPNRKGVINSFIFEENVSGNKLTFLRTSGELDESQAEATYSENTTQPVVTLDKPIPDQIKMNTVSGRYKSRDTGYLLELRIDVDGKHPLNQISGDYYRVHGLGSIISYRGSFIVSPITMNITSSHVTIQGKGNFTWSTNYPFIKVTIPRTTIFADRAPATVEWFDISGNPGPTCICHFSSIYFRTVEYEQDSVIGLTTPVFISYNTGSLPSGGQARVLSVQEAFAEAGIEIQTSGMWDVIPITDAGSNAVWSEAELHAAMLQNFSLWKDKPQWRVWLLAAQQHEEGYYGVMFDDIGHHRQGCAVFHQGIGGTTSDKLRLQLYTYVHELGHCFNLLHSWSKGTAQPPVPNRPNALSWMNYPWYYPQGGNAFWSSFPFQFDDLELAHLRHAFRKNIIMSGNDFFIGAAVEDPEAFSKPVVDNSGLKLEIRSPRDGFLLGEPVVVEIKLSLTDLRGVQVQTHLHPKEGFVQIGIQKPGGQTVVYEPLMEHLIAPDLITLTADKPSIYESAFISYGKGGFYFEQPGIYKLRAIYYSLDGSLVTSDTLYIRIKSPHTSTDEEVTDLFLGKEQGTLLYLLGSDSEFLKHGNTAFDTVLNEYDDHSLAVYAKLVKGFNTSRAFKSITENKAITVRPPMHEEATDKLSDVVDASEKGKGVDNITLNMTMLRMANSQKASGDIKGAKETAERMLDIFSKKSLKPHIMRYIESKVKKI